MLEKELFEKELLSSAQIKAIQQQQLANERSLLRELRLMLYIGVLLLSSGISYFTYLNIDSAGHLVLQALLAAAIGLCTYFIHKNTEPYSPLKFESAHPYLDHVLLLQGLLIGTLLIYLLVYYEWTTEADAWSSFLCAILFLFMAYRYDHRGLLSIGITALVAGFGLSISPVNWVQGDWMEGDLLPVTAIVLGISFYSIDHQLKRASIKAHFSFLIQLYAYLLFYGGAFGLYANSKYWQLDSWPFALSFCILALAIAYFNWVRKQFLFFLFSTLSAFINSIIFLALALSEDSILLLVYFIPISCIAFARLLLKNKNHFKS